MATRVEEFQLLGSGLSHGPRPVRPPWTMDESTFVRLCDHCGDCIHACPEQILVSGRGDYPEVDFSKGGCTFCGACRDACHAGGLEQTNRQPWDLKAFITRCCLTNHDTECRACGEQCETSAIAFRDQVGSPPVPMLDPCQCNGCGRCWSACPASAIRMYDSILEGGLLS